MLTHNSAKGKNPGLALLLLIPRMTGQICPPPPTIPRAPPPLQAPAHLGVLAQACRCSLLTHPHTPCPCHSSTISQTLPFPKTRPSSLASSKASLSHLLPSAFPLLEAAISLPIGNTVFSVQATSTSPASKF